MSIKKGVFPVAGLGTRFLPATKASPKEMLPIVDKPVIQYVVEEALESGIREITFVTGRGKRAIEDHFDISYELEHELKTKGKHALLKEVQEISELISASYVRQKEARGLGHAILTARDLVGKQPFAVFLGDDIIYSQVPCTKQLIDVYNKYKCSVIAVQKIKTKYIHKYGVIEARHIENNVFQVLDLVEKPTAKKAPSDLAIIGRYILTPEIFDCIEKTTKDHGGEIQLTDALRLLINQQAIYACEFEGKRYDTGDKIGFLKATIEFALRRPDIGEDVREYLQTLDIFNGNNKKEEKKTVEPVEIQEMGQSISSN
ncbi:MAG: UTP--glucose-1-phosphate uridylyltransferase GalU [bacterium]